MKVERLQPQHDRVLATQLLDLQHRSYAIEAALIGDLRIPPLHETVEDLQGRNLDWVGVRGPTGAVIGAAGFRDEPGHLGIDRLVVDPERLREGTGRLLVRWLQQRAGTRTVLVSTGRDNAPARRLYEQLGFDRTGDEEVLPGLWITLYEWRLPESPTGSDPVVGDLVIESFDYDGGRQVSVYLPADEPEAVVFAGDGQLTSRWGRHLEAADLPPTMIVGTHRTDDADELARLREYSPSFDAGRFAAHESFFVHDVRRWVRSRFGVALPAERTAVCGVSASGELSLAMGLRHPDLYGAVFSASPGGGFRPPAVMPLRLPRAYLVAGTLEPFFLENAIRWADALRRAGADVILTERVGTHGDELWAAEFPLMVAWAFGH